MKNYIRYTILLLSFGVFAQDKDEVLYKANEEFISKKYTDAEANYRIAQSKATKEAVSSYNLGNSIYRQNQIEEAKYSYLKAIENAKTRPDKHKAYHNLGNTLMKGKNYSQAVEAYKNALRNNPDDEETRYNYALSKKLLKENPPKNDDNKDKKNGKKDDKKDKDKDKEGKDKEKKDDKKEGDKDNKEDKGKEEKSEQKPQPGEISKERLERLMEAVNNEEKKIQDKVNAQKVKGAPVQTEKDW